MALIWEEGNVAIVILRPKDIQKILGISKAKAYELCRRKDFPARKCGRRYYISARAFERWLECNS